MAEKKAVDIPEGKAQPLGPGDPEEAPALSQMGSTFAERAKASSKAVDTEAAENKSVSSSRTSAKKKK